MHSKFYHALWHSPKPPKIHAFSWKCFQDIIPTSERLLRLFPVQDTICIMCNTATETLHHLLLTGPYTRATWFFTSWSLKLQLHRQTSVKELIKSWYRPSFVHERILTKYYWPIICAILSWLFWKERWSTIFSKVSLNHHISLHPFYNHTSTSSSLVSRLWIYQPIFKCKNPKSHLGFCHQTHT